MQEKENKENKQSDIPEEAKAAKGDAGRRQKPAATKAAIRYPSPSVPIVETAVKSSRERLCPILKAKVLAA